MTKDEERNMTKDEDKTNGTEKVKVIHFDVILEYPEDMNNEDILDSFASQIIDEASSITSDNIEIRTKSDIGSKEPNL